jgi:hypothetical protein
MNEVKLKIMMDICYLRGLLLNAKPGGCLTPAGRVFLLVPITLVLVFSPCNDVILQTAEGNRSVITATYI